MNREEKGIEVKALADRLQKATALLFAENAGLKSEEMIELRKKLSADSIYFKVVKNRLVKRALSEVKFEGLNDFFRGPTAIASSDKDPAVLAKRLTEFTKDRETLKIKGGYMQGAILDLNKIKALASLPSKEELYAKLLGCMQNPARGLVTVLSAVPRQLVTVINAIKDKKQ